jgi:hypothetical protein
MRLDALNKLINKNSSIPRVNLIYKNVCSAAAHELRSN